MRALILIAAFSGILAHAEEKEPSFGTFDCILFRYKGGEDARALLGGKFKAVLEHTGENYLDLVDVLDPDIRYLEKQTRSPITHAWVSSEARAFHESFEYVQKTRITAKRTLELYLQIETDCIEYDQLEKDKGGRFTLRERKKLFSRIRKNFWKFRKLTDLKITGSERRRGNLIDFLIWSRKVDEARSAALAYRKALEDPVRKGVLDLISTVSTPEARKRFTVHSLAPRVHEVFRGISSPTTTAILLILPSERKPSRAESSPQ